MKKLPQKINKSMLVELYSDQYNRLFILDEIRIIQIRLNVSVNKSLLANAEKKLFFAKFGIPTGYIFTDENKIGVDQTT